jgi:predicted transcriptional regulator
MSLLKPLTVRLPAALYARLTALADESHIALADLAREAIRARVDRHDLTEAVRTECRAAAAALVREANALLAERDEALNAIATTLRDLAGAAS